MDLVIVCFVYLKDDVNDDGMNIYKLVKLSPTHMCLFFLSYFVFHLYVLVNLRDCTFSKIRTGRIEKWDKERQSRERWMSHYMPPMAFERLFGTQEGPTSVNESTAAFAMRKVSMCPVYIIATNDSFLPELVELLETLPTRITLLRTEDFGRNSYEGCGVDRVANLHGAAHKYGEPALVIDGGTALTWTATDAKTGNVRGGGIAPGMAMKFKAMNAFTDKLPDLDFNEVQERIQRCAREQKAIKLYADSTSDAMMTSVFRETALLLAHVVRSWAKECVGKKTRDGVRVCVTGGDANIIATLLSKDRGYIIQKDKDGLAIPSEARIEVEKNIIHEGVASLLLEKTVTKKDMTKEEVGRNNCIGQRVIVKKEAKLLRGSVVDIVRGETIKDDKYKISLEDYTICSLDPTQLCGKSNTRIAFVLSLQTSLSPPLLTCCVLARISCTKPLRPQGGNRRSGSADCVRPDKVYRSKQGEIVGTNY